QRRRVGPRADPRVRDLAGGADRAGRRADAQPEDQAPGGRGTLRRGDRRPVRSVNPRLVRPRPLSRLQRTPKYSPTIANATRNTRNATTRILSVVVTASRVRRSGTGSGTWPLGMTRGGRV